MPSGWAARSWSAGACRTCWLTGCNVCDQDTHTLAGLIAPAIPGRVGMRVLAVLTDAGQRALADAEVAA